MKILSGMFLEVGIKEAWRKQFPKFSDYSPIKISIYDLIVQSQRNLETVSGYQLIYIGESLDVFRRLKTHEAILKISRDIAQSRSDKELFIWILKPNQNYIRITVVTA